MTPRANRVLATMACVAFGFCHAASAGDPNILVEPTNQVLMAGATASFTVMAAGTAPLNYQWLKNGSVIGSSARIAGADSANLVLRHLGPADAGSYSVVV